MFYKTLFCIDLISPIEPTPSSGNTNWGGMAIFITICVAIILAFVVFVGLTTYFLIKRRDDKKQLAKKKEPVAFTNKSDNDITIIATDNYEEIAIQFTLYDENNHIIKQYTIKELNFVLNEQRVIANLKDFDACKVGYSIQSYK